ncbi:hypothetical protein OSTOST_07685 [Ostertagia ostertagi]
MLSDNTEFSKAIKKEEDDGEGCGVQSNPGQHISPNPELSIRRIEKIGTKRPVKYIIRKAPTPTTVSALKRIFVGRSTSESKPDSKEIDKLTPPYDRPSSQNRHLVTNSSSHSEVERPVRFWRTPSGKLIKLDAKVPTITPVPGSLGTLTKTQPKFIRLPNGKLARISTKVIASFYCSEPIDVATLIGAGPTSSEETPLFKTSGDSPAIKDEPMDVEETPVKHESKEHTSPEQASTKDASPKEQTQKSQTYLRTPPVRQPLLSLAAALKSIAAKSAKRLEPIAPPPVHQQQPSLETALKNIAASSQVGDLGKIREQPLFSEDLEPVHFKESCNVCRVVIPGLKKNMISLEGRLTGLVETVQNLIMYLNPLDRKAAELASIEGNPPETAESSAPDLTAVPTSSEPIASDFGDISEASDGRIPSILLPVAHRNGNRIEMRTVGATEVVNSMGHRPNVVRFVRQPLKSAPVPDSLSSSPSTSGRIRFVVADRATTQRSVPCSSGGTHSARPDTSESSNQKAQVRIGPGEDVKPEYGSASSDKSVSLLFTFEIPTENQEIFSEPFRHLACAYNNNKETVGRLAVQKKGVGLWK